MKYELKKFNDGQLSAKVINEGDLKVELRGNS